MSNPALRPSCTLHTLVGYITSKTFFLQCNEYIQQVDVEKYRPAEYLTPLNQSRCVASYQFAISRSYSNPG
jgi:hypothetical protein